MPFEDERRPWRAVPRDALLAPLAGPAAADSLDGCWWAIELDGTRHDQAVRTGDNPARSLPRTSTIRRDLVAIGARTARHGRGNLTLHLPAGHHREQAWLNLWTESCGPPARGA